MEIYLDANATTPVLAQARQAALQTMADDFGNPSSVHTTGLKARAMMDRVRQRARRLLHSGAGQLLFTSGATEGIQTAVLSALSALRERRERGEPIGSTLLYGATEHKAVPETLRHWNRLLGLNLAVRAIPVDPLGRHDLGFLRVHATEAAMVCVMAANNETGVISDLAGVEAVLLETASPAFWMVDGVQALGKLPLRLAGSRIDYAPFSGHKLYAPKGIGLLYVREGAPFTPLLAGGGQEGSLRSGTENMSGIAALGAVLEALDDGRSFRSHAQLVDFRDQLAAALTGAFQGLVFNAPLELSLPTTLNFSVPGLPARMVLDLFDAADVRVSGGSACSAAKAQPSFVLEAMGLPAWQTASAVRLSFGPAADQAFITEACARIRACGLALQRSCLAGEPGPAAATDGLGLDAPLDGVMQFSTAGAQGWLVADAETRRCVVIDPLPEWLDRLDNLLRCQHLSVLAVVDRRTPGESDGARTALLERLGARAPAGPVDAIGWPLGAGQRALVLGRQWLMPWPMAGHARGEAAEPEASLAMALLLGHPAGDRLALADVAFAFVGDGLFDPALADLPPQALLCAAHDGEHPLVSTTASLRPVVRTDPLQLPGAPSGAALTADDLRGFVLQHPGTLLVDVREPYEQALGGELHIQGARQLALPLSRLVNSLAGWLAEPNTPLVFFCRTGNRSAQAAACLSRLGHRSSWTLAGGLALHEPEVLFMPAI